MFLETIIVLVSNFIIISFQDDEVSQVEKEKYMSIYTVYYTIIHI